MAVASSSSGSGTSVPIARLNSSQYQPLDEATESDDGNGNDAELGKDPRQPLVRPPQDTRFRNATYVLSVLLIILLASNLYTALPYSFHSGRGQLGSGSDGCPGSGPPPPQYFRTSPALWAGPTATGPPAFLAQTRVFDPAATYVPNEPLQTSIPIEGRKSENDSSIFKMMGHLTPYSPAPGWGVDEYPLPDGAEIVQVQMLSRHGARYPTGNANVMKLGDRIADAGEGFEPHGDLSFLKNWKYQLGAEVLVPKGRQELYESGKFFLLGISAPDADDSWSNCQAFCTTTCTGSSTIPRARSLFAPR